MKLKKNILIVDDSALMRRVICDIINSDERFQAKDLCKDGVEAFEKLSKTQYDAVLLDVNMPRMDGLELLDKINENRIHATVIMVSTLTADGTEETLSAMEKGAVDFVLKPENIIEARGKTFRDQIMNILVAVTKADVQSSGTAQITASSTAEKSRASAWPSRTPVMHPAKEQPFSVERSSGAGRFSRRSEPSVNRDRFRRSDRTDRKEEFRGTANIVSRVQKEEKTEETMNDKTPSAGSDTLIALACSTGGPKALHEVIPHIPKNINAPMVLVQHMPVGFTKLLAERLNIQSQVKVKEAEEGDILEKGTIYIAPGGKHLEVVSMSGGQHKAHLSSAPAIDGLRPCANVMYQSLESSKYKKIVCVVLTGMGSDGTKGITGLAKKKNIYVISQNEATCVVYGMPKAIAESGLVNEVVPLQDVAKTISKNTGVR